MHTKHGSGICVIPVSSRKDLDWSKKDKIHVFETGSPDLLFLSYEIAGKAQRFTGNNGGEGGGYLEGKSIERRVGGEEIKQTTTF